MLWALQAIVLALFAALLIGKAFTSLEWRMEHDTPLLHYAAFQMDRYDLVPYRDIFETSMPGTFAFHYAVGSLFGYGDAAFRYVDLALLSALLGVTYLFMRRFGSVAAIWSAIVFGLVYLGQGQMMSLQRDYIGIIPVAFALLCLPTTTNTPVRLGRFAWVGLLFGLAILIKPHLSIALPIVIGALLVFRWQSEQQSRRDLLLCAAVSSGALLIPLGITLAWLAANGALDQFLEIAFKYLPLHSSLNGDHETVSGPDRAIYLLQHAVILGGFSIIALAALAGYYNVAARPHKDKATTISLVCLGLCTVAYAVYPVLAGKFWIYHYMPLAYFCAISSGLCLFNWPQTYRAHFVRTTRALLLFMVFVVAVSLQLRLPGYLDTLASDLRSGPAAHAPKQGQVDEIAAWLSPRINPGDTVQTLDWAEGSIHALLLTKTRLTTRFMYDYHFYHAVSSPYIQGLRQEFIGQLRAAPPRFIIEILTNKPWVSGIDTTREFPELRQFIAAGYTVVFDSDDYLIYERASP